MSYALTAGIFLCVAYALTFFLRNYALKKDLIDNPNHRSSHRVPTPRGGGVSVVITILVSFLFAYHQQWLSTDQVLALLLPAAAVASIGFLDDHGHISAKWRFLVHLSSAAIALVILDKLPSLQLGGWHISTLWLLAPVYVVTLSWFINLYNFMDGIDGLASSQAVSVLAGASLILWLNGNNEWALLMLLAIPAILGFLIWNWPPAKIFMGDACSGFLGLVLGLLAIISASEHGINLWSWLILMGYFITDASYTLIRRMLDGQNWTSPHRSHAYQILSRRWGSHLKVTLLVASFNLIWLAPLAYLASSNPDMGIWLCTVAWAPVVLLAIKLKAGLNND